MTTIHHKKSITVICDGCGKTLVFYSSRPIRGWLDRGMDGWKAKMYRHYCPDCMEEYRLWLIECTEAGKKGWNIKNGIRGGT